MKKRIFPWLFLVLFVVILMLCEHFIFRTNIAKGWFWIVIGVFFLLVNGFNYFCRKLDLYLAIFLGLILGVFSIVQGLTQIYFPAKYPSNIAFLIEFVVIFIWFIFAIRHIKKS